MASRAFTVNFSNFMGAVASRRAEYVRMGAGAQWRGADRAAVGYRRVPVGTAAGRKDWIPDDGTGRPQAWRGCSQRRCGRAQATAPPRTQARPQTMRTATPTATPTPTPT